LGFPAYVAGVRLILIALVAMVSLIAVATGCGSSEERGEIRSIEAQPAREAAQARQRQRARQAQRAARRRARQRARLVAARQREARARRQAAAREAAEAARIEEEQEVESQEASECDPNYSGACLDPNASDYDCEGGSGDGPQYTGTVTVVGEDHYGLDANGNGVGCEAE
jgi:acyl-CoA reductase-like NAD-dependent aldehyde dehydrogenase